MIVIIDCILPKMIKTPMKKSLHNFSCHPFSKPIKLKFENIRTDEHLHPFTAGDSNNNNLANKYLEELVKEGKSSHHEVQREIYELLKKVKKVG
jgi:hypothetical protein